LIKHVAALLCLLPWAANASSPGKYSVIGFGMSSCGAWISNRADTTAYSRLSEQQWIVGFLSGIGFAGQGKVDPLNGVDAPGVWAWIDNYCRANPLATIAKAAEEFSYAHPR
jgi:hypothetical protein